MAPEQLPAQAPHVLFQNGQLTIDSENSSLTDILRDVKDQTGAQLDLPPNLGKERIAAHFSGVPREVLNGLLDGAHVGYIILGSQEDPNAVQKIILTTLPQEQNGGPATPGNGAARWPGQPNSESEEEPEAAEPEPPPPPPPMINPGQQQPPDQNAPTTKTGPQLLQNLQRLREQQQNAQPQQQQ